MQNLKTSEISTRVLPSNPDSLSGSDGFSARKVTLGREVLIRRICNIFCKRANERETDCRRV